MFCERNNQIQNVEILQALKMLDGFDPPLHEISRTAAENAADLPPMVKSQESGFRTQLRYLVIK